MINSNLILDWAISKKLQVIVNDKNFTLTKPWNISEATKENISFISDGWRNTNAGIVFTNTVNDNSKAHTGIVIVTAQPKLEFVLCIREFFNPEPCKVIKGNDVIIGEQCSIGKDGFQYINNNGKLIKFPHYGDVILEDEVEIGNTVNIARGALSNTILRRGVKVDNLVHIAHNVDIGENTQITANVMIAGSVKIGKNCWLGPSSSIKNQLVIEDNALIGIGAVVIKNVEANSVMIGNPAKLLRKQ